MTARLMCLLDALSGSGAPVVVLATTSRIGALDPALRRPGRLDVEVRAWNPHADRTGRNSAAGTAYYESRAWLMLSAPHTSRLRCSHLSCLRPAACLQSGARVGNPQ